MYPVRRSVRYLTGDAALLDDEAANKLLVDSRTDRRVVRVRLTLETSCAEAPTGLAASPVA